ncbi:hypothetical protein BXY66_0140 [Shimia isoporae]|uniref:Uncharacterized protein n=1 Tax=Shimia isoporae TaxID=647720 RepID=A0A4R1NIQ4_9RHOB|nr:hypothetical protein [Shimia isoporae]TCL08107.1 hypothetical protein BXY66_0140 [Shimia isoporae]
MTILDPQLGAAKPILLRVIFILNALKILFTVGFFVAFKFYGLSVHGLEGDSAANLMLLALALYVAAFGAIVASILKRNITGIRLALLADLGVSLYVVAPIGFVTFAVSMALTFSKPVRAYFAYRA